MHKSHFRDPQIHKSFEISFSIPIHTWTIQCFFFTRFIPKRTFIVTVTFFENIFTKTMVIYISSCTNTCFVNKAFRKTFTIHRIVCFSTAIASFGGRWCWTFHNFRIMFPDDIVHVRHTTVT